MANTVALNEFGEQEVHCGTRKQAPKSSSKASQQMETIDPTKNASDIKELPSPFV